MLAILQFDAASVTVLDRLLADGRLPVLAGLREQGTWHDLDAPATQFAAGAQHTLYSGVPLGDHGLFYPFQWSAADQRVRYMGDFEAPPPVWERLGPHGTRTLAVDPYESRPPTDAPPGALVCGWQLHDRVVLQQWDSPPASNDRLERLFGQPEPVDEVFGRHTVGEMLGLRRRLLGAPGRVADAAELYLREADFDLAWLTFCAAHVAGHQFWDLSQLDPDDLDDAAAAVLGAHARRRLRRRRRRPRSRRGGAARRRRRDGHLTGRHGRQHQPRRPAPRDARAILDRRASRHEARPARSGGCGRLLPTGLRAKVARRPARARRPRPHRAARAARRRLEPHRGRSPTRPRTRATSASTCAAASATASWHPRTSTPCSTRSRGGS